MMLNNLSHRVRKVHLCVVAAALSVGGAAWCVQAEPPATQPSDAAKMSDNTAKAEISAADKAGIRDLLMSVTDTGVSRNADQNLTQYFTVADHDRIMKSAGVNPAVIGKGESAMNKPANASANGAMANGAVAGGSSTDNSRGGVTAAEAAARATAKATANNAIPDNKDLNARIEQLRKDWEEKYHLPFDVKDKEVVFNDDTLHLLPGDVGEPARTASEKVLPSTPQKSTDNAADKNVTVPNAQNSATLRIPASKDGPALDILLMRGADAATWKIATPAIAMQQQLHDNLVRELTAIDDAKATWPADVNDGYRLVSHRVLMAIANPPTQNP